MSVHTSGSGNTPDPSSTRLSGNLGVFAIVFAVVAAAAPLAIFVTFWQNMLASNGAGLSFDYLVAPLLLLIFAVGFAAMSFHVEKAGAFYSYVAAALGRPIGVGAGFVALSGYLLFQTFIYALFGVSTHEIVARFTGTGGFNLAWWLWALIGMAIVAWLGYLNVNVSAKVLGVALILEVAVIVILDVAVLGQAETVSFEPFYNPEIIFSGPLAIGLLFGVSIGIGFEATAIYRDEARNPKRTIPRAIYVTIISAAVFYSLAIWAFTQAFGADGIVQAAADQNVNLVYNVAAEKVGLVFSDVTRVLGITSSFAAALAYHNIAARYLHSLGHSVLPEKLARVHGRQKSPHIASLTISVISLLMLVFWLMTSIPPEVFMVWPSAAGTLSIVILFVLTSVAIFIFFRKNRGLNTKIFPTVISPVVSFFALGAILVAALINFPVIAGDNPIAINLTLALLPFAMFGVGVLVALRAKKRDPERYDRLREHGQATVRISVVGEEDDIDDTPSASSDSRV